MSLNYINTFVKIFLSFSLWLKGLKSLSRVYLVLCFIYLLLFCLSETGANAQSLNFNFKNHGVDEGLSQSTVNVVIQDSRGFMWFGTQIGLNRYDGYSYKTFYHKKNDTTSLSNAWIYDIAEDKKGFLWIGTKNGLNCMNPKTGKCKRFLHDPYNPYSINSNTVYGVLIDKDGVLWVKTENAINKYDSITGKFHYYEHHVDYFSLTGRNTGAPIIEDSYGNIWVGTENGLNVFDKDYEQYKRFSLQDAGDYSRNYITSIVESNDGVLWVGTKKGVYGLDLKTMEFSSYHDTELNDIESYVLSLFIDTKNRLWVGYSGEGIEAYDAGLKRIGAFKNAAGKINSLSHNSVISFCEDKSHNLWIGTEGGGVDMINLKNKKFNLIDANSGLSYNDIASIIEYKDLMWIGLWGKGIDIFKAGKKYLHLNTETPGMLKLKDNFVHSFYEDRRGNLWVGTRAGIQIFRGFEKGFETVKDVYGVNFNVKIRVYAIVEDSKENVWIGTKRGLYKINLKNRKQSYYKHSYGDTTGLIGNLVYTLLLNNEQELWVGTDNGISIYNEETDSFKQIRNEINNPNSLSSNEVYDLIDGVNNLVWAATDNGINRIDIDKNEFMQFGKPEGLAGDEVFCFRQDNNYNLWMAGTRGLSKLNTESFKITNYGLSDGVQSLEFNHNASFVAKDGEIFFGGIKGVNYFYPDSIKKNRNVPAVVITGIEVKSAKRTLRLNPDTIEMVELSHKDYMLTIEFSVPEYSNTSKNIYKYKLENISNEWNDIGNRNFAMFSNLSPGSYTFKVKGANSDKVFNEKAASIKILVHPPFWKTPWAYAAYLLIIGFIVYVVGTQRTKKLKEQNQILKEKQLASLEVEKQREVLSIKNKSITDSINYAKRIQEAMMPSEYLFKKLLSDSFILYMPKDIVSGDFYWIDEKRNKVFVAAVDCTGHGVPGAFMSIIGYDLLRSITKERDIENPAQILNQLNRGVSETFRKKREDDEVKDGMDLSLIVIDKHNMTLEYAGAINPVYIVRNKKLIEIKGNRFSVGSSFIEEDFNTFENHQFGVKPGDIVYIFSDGYPDQFGGPNGKKFKYRRFRNLLLKIHQKSLKQQKAILEETINDWKGDLEQVDDILVIGIKISNY